MENLSINDLLKAVEDELRVDNKTARQLLSSLAHNCVPSTIQESTVVGTATTVGAVLGFIFGESLTGILIGAGAGLFGSTGILAGWKSRREARELNRRLLNLINSEFQSAKSCFSKQRTIQEEN